MSKKIVVLTGSARTNGNSAAMAEAFIAAARAKGHTVIRHDAALMNIGGCHGCETCYSTGKPCTFDDDFNSIAEDLLSADGIVFSMPLYWYSMPGQIKNVIDKMFSFVIGGKNFKGKEVGLLACCEESDPAVLDGIRIPYDRPQQLDRYGPGPGPRRTGGRGHPQHRRRSPGRRFGGEVLTPKDTYK